MDSNQIAIATMTLARRAEDERVILDALQRLSLDRWRVVVSDGGSRPEFVKAVASLPSFTMAAPRAKGLVGQIKAAVTTALTLDAPFVLYSEPDKFDFFDEHLGSFVEVAPNQADVGVVLAARTPGSFARFPPVQRIAEDAFNRLSAPLLGDLTDYLYGPFLMNREVAAHVDSVRDDLGWGWRPYIFAEARRLGYRVVSVVGDFPCPADAQLDDRAERLHRMRQLRQNVDGVLQSVDRPA